MNAKALEVTPYLRGTNPIIDEVLIPDETCWIINGPLGRLPVLAHTEEEARERYLAKAT